MVEVRHEPSLCQIDDPQGSDRLFYNAVDAVQEPLRVEAPQPRLHIQPAVVVTIEAGSLGEDAQRLIQMPNRFTCSQLVLRLIACPHAGNARGDRDGQQINLAPDTELFYMQLVFVGCATVIPGGCQGNRGEAVFFQDRIGSAG